MACQITTHLLQQTSFGLTGNRFLYQNNSIFKKKLSTENNCDDICIQNVYLSHLSVQSDTKLCAEQDRFKMVAAVFMTLPLGGEVVIFFGLSTLV